MTEHEAIDKFRSACAILREISTKTIYEFYVAGDSLCMLRGSSHDRNGHARQENVVDTDGSLRISGGDW